MTAPTTIDGDVMLTDDLQSNPLFEALKLAVGMLSLHGHEDDAKKVVAEAKRVARSAGPVAEVTNYRDTDGDLRAGVVFLGKSPAAGTLLYTSSPAAPAQSGEPVSDDHASVLWSLARMVSCTDWIKEFRKSLYAAPQSSQPVEAGEPCEHCKVIRPYHDLDCPVAAKVLAEKSAEALDDERAATREVIEPLTEPVYIKKALLGGRNAHVVLSGGTGPKCAVFLVNIQLTGWNTNEEWAKGYASGFNQAAAWMQDAILDRAASPQATATRTFSDEQIAALRVAADALIERYAAPIRAILANAEQATATQPAQTELRRIARELRAYNPAADEYKGKHIHKVWALEIDDLLTAAHPETGGTK